MSTVQPTDKTLVNRAGVDHSAPADMSTVQDTDLLLINRAGVDYKCTFLDWKNSQSKPPNMGAVTLSDVAGGSRFTSVAFPVSLTMTEDGVPPSAKKLKAYVEGVFTTSAESDLITKITTPAKVTTYEARWGSVSSATPLSSFATANPVWSAWFPQDTTAGAVTGPGPAAFHVLEIRAPAAANLVFGVLGGKGFDAGQSGYETYASWSNDGATWSAWVIYSPGKILGINSIAGFTPPAAAPHWRFTFVNPISVPPADPSTITSYQPGSPDYYGILDSIPLTTLTFASNKNLSSFVGGDAVTEVGNGNDGRGVVGAVDVVANTMTFAKITAGAWNIGSAVKGPLKAGANVKLYCKLDAAGAVSDLQSADPGFTAWTPAGTGPYTGTVTFPATLPSGAAPDTDLPAGTTITVEVQATNTAGTDSAKSNVLTPA